MSSENLNIVDAALSLSDLERANLAYRLLQSLKVPAIASEADNEFQSELEQRVIDYDAGRTQASDWDEVANRLRSALSERKSS